MFTISAKHRQAFEAAVEATFEKQMVEDLQSFAPHLCKVAGEAAVRHVIQLGIQRAGDYGLSRCGPVRFYIELMFALGCEFDSDLQLPWAGSVLKDESIPDEMSRADRLYEAMCGYCDQVVGAQNEYVIRALRRATQIQLENIDFLDGGIKQAAVTMLQRLYPEKGSHLGEDTLRLVVRRGFDVADRYGIGSNKGCFLVSGLLYCFGHGIANDALYPWVADSLCCPAPHGVDDKVQRLYQKASVYLERMLRHLE